LNYPISEKNGVLFKNETLLCVAERLNFSALFGTIFVGKILGNNKEPINKKNYKGQQNMAQKRK